MITNDKELTGSQIISDFSFVWISLVHAAAVRCCQKLFDEVMVSYLGGGGLGCWGLGEVWFRFRKQETQIDGKTKLANLFFYHCTL